MKDYNYCVLQHTRDGFYVSQRTVNDDPDDYTSTVPLHHLDWHVKTFFAPQTTFVVGFENGVSKLCSRLTGEQILIVN